MGNDVFVILIQVYSYSMTFNYPIKTNFKDEMQWKQNFKVHVILQKQCLRTRILNEIALKVV